MPGSAWQAQSVSMSETPPDNTAEQPADARKVLLLVDGSSYLYRAFHAMPDLRAVPGDPTSPATGAIRGMINMMQKLRKDVRADYACCVFDAPGKTFRDDLYPEYKANRSPMPDDLRSQIPPIHEVVRLLGWPDRPAPRAGRAWRGKRGRDSSTHRRAAGFSCRSCGAFCRVAF